MSPQEFHCRGSFGPFHAGHPNEQDLQNLETFIKNGFEGINYQAEQPNQPVEQQIQQQPMEQQSTQNNQQ